MPPFDNVYECEVDDMHDAFLKELATKPMYKEVRSNARHRDFLRIDLSVLPDVDMLIMTPPCSKFTSLLHGTKDKAGDKIKMGLGDANVQRWARKCGRMCTLRKFKLACGENVKGFFFGCNNGAWLQLKHLAETAGYEVVLEEIDIANLEMPMSRPRWFFAFIRNDVDWDSSEFERNFDALVHHEREGNYDINSTKIQSQDQLRKFRVSQLQVADRLAGTKALTDRERSIVKEVNARLGKGQKKRELSGKRKQGVNCRVVDVSKSGWEPLHATPNEFPCVTASNTKKLFVIGNNWNCTAYPQELGLALGFEATPLSAMCVALEADTPVGLNKLCGMLGRCASPAAWRVWVGGWVNTLGAVFSCNGRQDRTLLDADEGEAPRGLTAGSDAALEGVAAGSDDAPEEVAGGSDDALEDVVARTDDAPEEVAAVSDATLEDVAEGAGNRSSRWGWQQGLGVATTVCGGQQVAGGAISTPARHLQGPMGLHDAIYSGATCATPHQPTGEIAAANTDQGQYVVDAKVKCWYRSDTGKGRMYVVTITDVLPTGFTVMYGDQSIEYSVSKKRLRPLTSSVRELLDSPARVVELEGAGGQLLDFEGVDAIAASGECNLAGGTGEEGGAAEDTGGRIWRNEVHMTRGAKSFIQCAKKPNNVDMGQEWLAYLEADGATDCGGGVDCCGRANETPKQAQARQDKQVARKSGDKFKIRGNQFQVDEATGVISFARTPSSQFRAVAGHKGDIGLAHLCESVYNARSKFPWMQHWINHSGGWWPFGRMSFWIANGKGCDNSWSDACVATVKCLVDAVLKAIAPSVGEAFNGPNLTAQVHAYRSGESIKMHRDSSRSKSCTLDSKLAIVHIYVSGEACICMSTDMQGKTNTVTYGAHSGGVTVMDSGTDDLLYHNRANLGLGEEEVAMSVILRHYTGDLDNTYTTHSEQFCYDHNRSSYVKSGGSYTQVRSHLDWTKPLSSKVDCNRGSIAGPVYKDLSVAACMAVNSALGEGCMLRHDSSSDYFTPGDVFRKVTLLRMMGMESAYGGAVKGKSPGGAVSVYCNHTHRRYTVPAWECRSRTHVGDVLQINVNAHNKQANGWMQQSIVSSNKVRLYGKLASWCGNSDVGVYLGDAIVVANVVGAVEPNARWWYKLEFEVTNHDQNEVLGLWSSGHECNEVE
jgi:site-specific DNA-cytosine methylase